MKYVLESSTALGWYTLGPQFAKAQRLRSGCLARLHDILAPDSLPTDTADLLRNAERRGDLLPGRTIIHLDDLRALGIELHPASTYLNRAVDIAFSTRLSVHICLYLALAERENCEVVTVDTKLLRKCRKLFPFVISLDSLP